MTRLIEFVTRMAVLHGSDIVLLKGVLNLKHAKKHASYDPITEAPGPLPQRQAKPQSERERGLDDEIS